MLIREIATKPYSDQKSGTAGLRKKVAVVQQPHYLENFLQSIFNVETGLSKATLIIGGDGRYYNRTAIQTAIAMAAANDVATVIVGQNGILSTPAASNLIRKTGAAGGLLFTASHNPAGPDGDFGIKFNVAGGGQASEQLTGKIYEQSRAITRYRIVEGVDLDLSALGELQVEGTRVLIVDSVDAYAELQQSLFDFDLIRSWLASGHSLVFDAMHAATGPYARRILIDLLGAPRGTSINDTPLEDFGGGHPDPNLIYGKHLVDLIHSPASPDLAAASDGDGDRNMILGRGLFISPGDSLAMLTAHLDKLPGYRGGLKGVARSMPTCRAVDQVAAGLGLPCYETPTGWKFFCNLMDSDRVTLCGEESFGTSSSHTREKDGLWAVLAWLNVLAVTGQSVREIAETHWRQYGRHYYSRYDYEDLPAAAAENVMHGVLTRAKAIAGLAFLGEPLTLADEFSYQDQVDGSIARHQGMRLVFGDSARIILRLSGTGTQGATLRLYLERYERDEANLGWDTGDALAPLIALAETVTGIAELTGRRAPDVVT